MAKTKGITNYTKEFKHEVITRLISTGSFSQTKEYYCISYTSLRKWVCNDSRKEAIKLAKTIGTNNHPLSLKIKVAEKAIYSNDTYQQIADYYKVSLSSVSKWKELYLLDPLLLENKSGKHLNHDSKIDIYNFDLHKLNLIERIKLASKIQAVTDTWTRIEKYQFIDMVGKFKTFLYKTLDISKQSFSYWKKAEKPMNSFNQEINDYVVKYHNKYKHMGYRNLCDKINFDLSKKGIDLHLTDYLVYRYMKFNKFKGIGNGRVHKPNYDKRNKFYDDRNIINRNFRSKEKYRKWYIDYTYMKVNGEFQYVLFIVDGYDKEVMHQQAYKKKTTRNVVNAVKKLIKERNVDTTKLIIHTDQGNEFTSGKMAKLCESFEILQSFSRAGKPLDNALIESIISQYKRGVKVYKRKIASTRTLNKFNNEWNYLYNYEYTQRCLGCVPPRYYNL